MLQTDKDERKRGDEETAHPAALGQRRLQISQLTLTSSAHFLQMLDFMLHVSVITSHMALGRNSSGVITLARAC